MKVIYDGDMVVYTDMSSDEMKYVLDQHFPVASNKYQRNLREKTQSKTHEPPRVVLTEEERQKLIDELIQGELPKPPKKKKKKRRCTKSVRADTVNSLNLELANECPICSDDVHDGEQRCCHGCQQPFHSACLKQWLQKSPSCPMCRCELN